MSFLVSEMLSLESNSSYLDGATSIERDLAMESAHVEILEAEREVILSDLRQEEFAGCFENLTNIMASMESAMSEDERGFSKQTAEAYKLAIYSCVGDAMDNPIPSLESFSGYSSAAEASKLSLEGMGNMIAKIWQAIKRVISRAIAAVRDFFGKLFGGAKSLKGKYEELEKELEKKSDTAKEAKLDCPGASIVHIDGKVDTNTLTVKGPDMVKDLCTDTLEIVIANSNTYLDELFAFYKSLNESSDGVEFNENSVKLKDTKANTGAMLPGGKTLVYYDKQTKAQSATTSSVTKKWARIGEHAASKPMSGKNVETDALTTAQIKKIIDTAKLSLSAIEGKEEAIKKITTKRDELTKEVDNFSKDLEKWSEKAGTKWTKMKANSALRTATRSGKADVSSILSYSYTYFRSMYNVCKTMSNNLKGADGK